MSPHTYIRTYLHAGRQAEREKGMHTCRHEDLLRLTFVLLQICTLHESMHVYLESNFRRPRRLAPTPAPTRGRWAGILKTVTDKPGAARNMLAYAATSATLLLMQFLLVALALILGRLFPLLPTGAPATRGLTPVLSKQSTFDVLHARYHLPLLCRALLLLGPRDCSDTTAGH